MTYALEAINPFYAARQARAATPIRPQPPEQKPDRLVYVKLPRAPRNASPVPRLTSLYHLDRAGEYGDRKYPGNCGGNLIRDLITFFGAKSVFDPMTGSGTCRDVCKELGIYCWSSDIHEGFDACDASRFPRECFEFCWLHPPYWRQKPYADDPRDLSRAPTVEAFLERYGLLLRSCTGELAPGGRMAVLMGDYHDREAGFLPLVYHTKRLAFAAGLRQHCTDIIRFSHGASSSKKVYRSSFIPGLHDVCTIFERP
jgi:hypothetical protein